MLKDYITVIVGALFVVSIIGLVGVNDDITGNSVSEMQTAEAFEPLHQEPTPPPKKSLWERFIDWITVTKTAIGTGQDVSLNNLPSDVQGFVKEQGGLVGLARQGVGKIIVLGERSDEYLLPGSGEKALVVLPNVGEGVYNIELKSGEVTFTIKAKVKATETSAYGIGDLPATMGQEPIDGFVVTDDRGRTVNQGLVNSILKSSAPTIQEPSIRTEAVPFYCCKDGPGTEGTGYYEERDNPEDCTGLVKQKCSDSSGKEKDPQFIGSYNKREAARECNYGYKCIGDKITKLCGDDYTSAAGASHTKEGAQPCPRPKMVTVSCPDKCASRGLLASEPTNFGSNILQSLESGGDQFYCQDIAISFSAQRLEECTCFENKAPILRPAGTAVCQTKCGAVPCGGAATAPDGTQCTCEFKGWEADERGIPVAIVSSGK